MKESTGYMLKPYRVIHDGNVVQGFDDMESAVADAEARNKRAKDLGVTDQYTAEEKN